MDNQLHWTIPPVPRPSEGMGPLVMIVLALSLAYVLGSGNGDTPTGDQQRPDLSETNPVEDWHGNVKRSHWTAR